MKVNTYFLHRKLSLCAATFFVLLSSTATSQGGLLNMVSKAKPTSVTLVTQLPPIAVPSGKTVQLQTSMADKTMSPQAAEMLKQQIRTLLLSSKEANLQLVDSSADTVIKCSVTSFEPKVVHPGTTQEGMTTTQIATWEGNMAVSVQVEDREGHSIDAANLKSHLENDYVLGKKESAVGSLFGKVAKTDKAAEMLNLAHGGNIGEMAQAFGAGTALGQALNISQGRNQPQPTDTQWTSALIETMAAKVANRIVPVDQAFIATLPVEKDFDEIRTLATANHWGEVQEHAEKMPQQKPAVEADRLYLIGLSYEALANANPKDSQAAADLMNKATKYYGDAHVIRPADHNLVFSQLRAADSLDHYLEVQHYKETKAAAVAATVTAPKPPAAHAEANTSGAADNNSIVEMVKANVPESAILTFVRTAPDPKFDASAPGLLVLGRGGVPGSIITAVQQRMTATPAARPATARRAK